MRWPGRLRVAIGVLAVAWRHALADREGPWAPERRRWDSAALECEPSADEEDEAAALRAPPFAALQVGVHHLKAYRRKGHERREGRRNRRSALSDAEEQQGGEEAASAKGTGARAKGRSDVGTSEELTTWRVSAEKLMEAERELLENHEKIESMQREPEPHTYDEKSTHNQKLNAEKQNQIIKCGQVRAMRALEAPRERSSSQLEKLKIAVDVSKGGNSSKDSETYSKLIQIHEERVRHNNEVTRILSLCDKAEDEYKLKHMWAMLEEVIRLEKKIWDVDQRLMQSMSRGGGQQIDGDASFSLLCEKAFQARLDLTRFCSDEQRFDDKMHLCTARGPREIERRINHIERNSRERQLNSRLTEDVVEAWRQRFKILEQQDDRKGERKEAMAKCAIGEDEDKFSGWRRRQRTQDKFTRKPEDGGKGNGTKLNSEKSNAHARCAWRGVTLAFLATLLTAQRPAQRPG